MATRTKEEFIALYGTTGTIFPDNTTGLISEADVRAFGQDIADSFQIGVLRKFTQITGGASTRTIGSAPQTIIAAPGAGYFLNIISVCLKYDYGSTAYNFGAAAHPVCKFSGATDGDWRLTYSIMNGVADFNRTLDKNANDTYGSINAPTNTAFVLTTANTGDATTGDGDLQIVVVYTLEAIN